MTAPLCPDTIMILNEFQKAVLVDYDDGEYSYLIQDGAIADLSQLGDTLLVFLLVELSTKEDTVTLQDAFGRISKAQDDLEVVMAALVRLDQNIATKLSARYLAYAQGI